MTPAYCCLTVVDNGVVGDGMVGHMVDGGMLLLASLGGEGQGDLLTAGLSDHDLLLVDGVGGIDELGNVETLVLNLVLALDLGDLDLLGDADLLGGGVGEAAGDLQGGGDEGDLVGLGLVLLTADLVLPGAVALVAVAAVSGSSAGGDLHGLGLLLVGDLGGGAGGGHILLLVHVGADLTLHNGGGLLAHCQHTVEAVVVVHHLLDGQGDRGDGLGEGGHTDLCLDAAVGVATVVDRVRGVAVAGGGGPSQGGEGGADQKAGQGGHWDRSLIITLPESMCNAWPTDRMRCGSDAGACLAWCGSAGCCWTSGPVASPAAPYKLHILSHYRSHWANTGNNISKLDPKVDVWMSH